MTMSSYASPARASLSSQAFRWALPRLAIYAGAGIGCVIAFAAWAAFYTYIWPGVDHAPPQVIEPADVPAQISPTPARVTVPSPPRPAPSDKPSSGDYWMTVPMVE